MRATMSAQAALFGHFHPKSFNVETLRRSQRGPFRVKLRRTQHEQMSFELPVKADIAQPIRTILPSCCARTASGHAAAAPSSNPINSRRFIAMPPMPTGRALHISA